MASPRSTGALAVTMALALVAGCQGRREHSDDSRDPAESKVDPIAECKSLPPDTIALLEPTAAVATELPCPLALTLELDGESVQLSVRSLAPAAAGVLATGSAPESCGPELGLCEFEGVHDEIGPILIARERGYESEVPAQLHLGFTSDGQLGFAPTWHGLPMVGDHTRLGPAWALAPHDCDGELQLRWVPRLVSPRDDPFESPSDAMLGLAGRWTLAEDGSASPPVEVEVEVEVETPDCRPIAWPTSEG